MHWQNLLVYDYDGFTGLTLEEMVKSCPANLDSAVLDEKEKIVQWELFLLAAEHESPDWDTPKNSVNWNGLSKALNR